MRSSKSLANLFIIALTLVSVAGAGSTAFVSTNARAASGTPEIVDPTPGSTLSGSVATFRWDPNGAYFFWLFVGTWPAGDDSGTVGVDGPPNRGCVLIGESRRTVGLSWVAGR